MLRNVLMILFGTALALTTAGCASKGETQATTAEAESPRVDRSKQTEDATYDEDAMIQTASEAFGEGAEGIAKVIEKIFSDLGRPNAYIVGREAGGGLVAALRYGDGVLHHKIEGKRDVHWTGPSIGFEIGGDAAKVFALVYNLYDTEEIFRRFPALEGQAYLIAGAGVSYHQRGDVIVAPIRLGVGYRFTANVGYIKYTKDRTINPF